MSEMARIRKTVFRQTQAAFARAAGVAQPTVSRWENGSLQPTKQQLFRIREAAIKAGIEWNDSWFFESAFPKERTEKGGPHVGSKF